MRTLAILVLAILPGCVPLYMMERMQLDLEARRGYAAYCREHVQECVDAYNRSQHIYVNR